MIIPSYRLSTLCIYLMNFCMAWDSFVTFLSLNFYWQEMAPDRADLYGMVYASYSLAQSLVAPFLGYWADKRSIREVVLACFGIDILGNLMFILASCGAQTTFGGMVLVLGRFLSGGAAGCIIIGLSFVTQLSSYDDRLKVLNYYRVWGFIGRFVSAVVSIGFMFVANPVYLGGSSCQIASYTLAPMTTIALDLTVVGLCFVLLKNPPAREARVPFWKDPATVRLFKTSCILNTFFWAACITMWTVFSQIIPVSVILFDMSQKPQWAWVPFLPFFLGLVLGWASVLWPLSKFFSDFQMMIGSPFIMVASLFSFLQFSTKSPQWVFFIGTTILYMAFNIFNTAYQSYYTKVVGTTSYISTLMSALLVTGAFGQFCGPMLTSVFMSIDCPKNACAEGQSYCSACNLKGINVLIPTVMVLMLGVTLFQFYFIRRVKPLQTPATVVESSTVVVSANEKQSLLEGGVPRIAAPPMPTIGLSKTQPTVNTSGTNM